MKKNKQIFSLGSIKIIVIRHGEFSFTARIGENTSLSASHPHYLAEDITSFLSGNSFDGKWNRVRATLEDHINFLQFS